MSEKDELDQIRNDFFEASDEQLNHVEHLLLNLDSKDKLEQYLKEIFRCIHSVKGGSGSLNLSSLSTILHYFEDYLGDNNATNNLEEFVDNCLKCVDIIRKGFKDSKTGQAERLNEDIVEIKKVLSVKKVIEKQSVLIIDSSDEIQEVTEVLDSHDITYKVVSDGHVALNYVLTERFKLIVVRYAISKLDGISLTSGIKVMKTINKRTPVIFISSYDGILNDFPNGIQPDYLINKNKNLKKDFEQIIKIVFKKVNVGHEVNLKFRKVLYIEDDLILQKVFEASAKKRSEIEFKIASSIAESQEILTDFTPDVILLDNILKDELGEDFLYFMGRMDKIKNIPVVYLTATPGKLNISHLKTLGPVKGIIAKPYKVDELLFLINNFLD